ncbi:hypothetical protein ABZ896_30650 [Streptomyces sp. NPDC047072]|uniref:DUF7674 family protein n=1 Tax=Streptomyces sp. NPDC047072 TaxID=3154809 RepID=UPI0033E292BE
MTAEATNPSWWAELVGISEVLADTDRADIEHWRGPEPGDDDSLPPLTVRLSVLGAAYGKHAAEFSPDQVRRLFGLVERVMTEGTDEEGTAVATGFLEAVLSAWDEGLDLAAVWEHVGPRSREYCRGWNDFTGVGTPGWMR